VEVYNVGVVKTPWNLAATREEQMLDCSCQKYLYSEQLTLS